jgi:hypothetical protein
MSLPRRPDLPVVPLLALLAEGAWLAVAYAAVETGMAAERPLLSTLELATAAGLAALAVHRRWINPDEQPIAFMLLVIGIGAVGWLWSDAARAALLSGDAFAAVGLHPGGWLTGVAFLRGVAGGGPVDDRALSRFALVGLPAVGVPWIFGQATAAALRPVFFEAAFVATITFTTTAFAAAGLARLQDIGRETSIDWRTDRAWLLLVVIVVGLVVAVAVPAALLLGVPIGAVARGLVDPVATLLGYVLLIVALPLVALGAMLYYLVSALGVRLPPPPAPGELAGLPFTEQYTFEQLRGGLLAVAVFWAVVLLLTFILVRQWLTRESRRGRRSTGDEQRAIVSPQGRPRLQPPRLSLPDFRLSARPRDAAEAYVAALRALRRHAALARAASETPLAHARRVRRLAPAIGGGDLSALAADYALMRYGLRVLSPAEHHRAIRRYERIRSRPDLRQAGETAAKSSARDR